MLLNFLFAEWEAEDGSHTEIESGGCGPAWQKSLSHQGSKVALSNVESVGAGECEAPEVGGLPDALSVVESEHDSLIELPIVVIHCSSVL